ncbi:MAG: peroxidase-related enzyme [Deinococcota bacterium]
MWIKHIPFADARGRLKKLYDRIVTPDGYIDNIMKVHSLRANTLEGHMAIYKNVLHHNNNTQPKWLLEAAGSYVSYLNGCQYCYQHHATGMTRLLNNDAKAASIKQAIEQDALETAFDAKELAIMTYAKALTLEPAQMQEDHLDALRKVGLDDADILELNQVISYFAYANRTVLGLGVTTDGEVLGLSPNENDDPDNWQHS